jgi:hypothetical protein
MESHPEGGPLYYEGALKLDTGKTATCSNMAIIFSREKTMPEFSNSDCGQATENFEKAIRINPANAKVYYYSN